MSWRPHPSRRAHAHSTLPSRWSTRAPQGEDGRARGSSLNRSLYSVFTMSNSPSRSRGACLRPGFCNFASLTRIEGWAERRETFGCSAEHPWGVSCASKTRVNALMTRYARRLRGALRPMTRDARLSALHRGGFRLPGPRFRLLGRPPFYNGGQFAFRIRAASSSHPGRSAWRAGSLPPGANGYEPPPQDATPRSAFRIVSRTRPQ
jgi:hypothetical protein